MNIGGLSLIGLLFASATSVTNAFTDVARKKALENHDLIATSFAIKFFAMLTYAVVLGARLFSGSELQIKDSGPVFGFTALDFSPLITFLIYLAIDVTLVSCATLLYYRAVQVSPLSLCMPFIAFTPVFLIPTGYALLGELPSTVKLVGVLLVVIGSLVMHRQLFAVSWAEPIKAILREPGSRYMLIVAFIFSLTNPLDAQLVRMSGASTQAFAYGSSICLLFGLLAWGGGRTPRPAMRDVPLWIVLAGVLEAAANILQFSSHIYIAVVITISLKRAGIVLVVLLGWLVFKERDITDKLIAATVMVAGALMFYLPMSLDQSLTVAFVTLVGMGVALYSTRRRAEQTELATVASAVTKQEG